MARTPDDLGIEHRPDGSAVLHMRLGSAPLDLLPQVLQAAQALIEEAFAAAVEGRTVVWLVARVPLDIPAETRIELVRRAGAVLSELNTHPDIGDGPPPGPDDAMAETYRRGWEAGQASALGGLHGSFGLPTG